VERLSAQEPTAPAPQDFLSVAQFSQVTGLSASTVRRLIADKKIPALQPGGHRCRIVIPLQALACVPPRGSTPDEAAVRHTPDSSPAPIPGPKPRWRRGYPSNPDSNSEKDYAP
jgi:excisionase family DNA binding protein